ncbi:MAG: DUF4389 domain-containing protein [Polyangiales bacterium]
MTQATENGPASPPVSLEITAPRAYDAKQLLMRLLVCAALGLLHQSFGRLFLALYVLLPMAASLLIARSDGRGLAPRERAWLQEPIAWIVAFYAYMLFVTDRFPLDAASRPLTLSIRQGAQSSTSSGKALFRLLSGLPYAICIALVGIVASVIALILACHVLVARDLPRGLYGFQRDFLAWTAHYFAYLASLVDETPSARFTTRPTISAGDGPQSA